MSVRRFQFDDSFDADSPFSARRKAKAEPEPPPPPPPPPEPEPPPPPPEPTFSEAEVAAAKAQGYKEGEKAGHAAGYAKGMTDGYGNGAKEGREQAAREIQGTVDAQLAGALENIASGIAEMLAERNATNVMRRDQPVHIAMAILRKVLPESARRGALNEIEGLVHQCLTEMVDEPRFVVRVAEELQGEVRERLETLADEGGFSTRLIVVGDPSIGYSDCRIEWADGGMERDTNQLLDDVSHVMESLLEAPPA